MNNWLIKLLPKKATEKIGMRIETTTGYNYNGLNVHIGERGTIKHFYPGNMIYKVVWDNDTDMIMRYVYAEEFKFL